MAVWQTKEDLLVQLTSLVDDEKSEAAFQLKSFQDPQGDVDVVRMLLQVVAKQNKTGKERKGQDRTGQDRTRQDRTGQDRPGQDRT